MWDAETGRELRRAEGFVQGPRLLAPAPDGVHLLCGGLYLPLRWWNSRTGEDAALLVKGEGGSPVPLYGVLAAAYSPDGARIVSASWDETVRLWDARTGAEAAVMAGHTKPVTTAGFSPDGSRIFSGSQDGTVRIWATVRYADRLRELEQDRP